jgi:transcription initiation factor TFIIH subunit 3
MSFLPSPSLRTALAVPTQRAVDLRASCFCHRRVVDVACVCSVCLSSASAHLPRCPGLTRAPVFCQPVPVCKTCKSKFPMKTLQRLKASQPPQGANGSANANGSQNGNGNGNGNALPNSGSIGRR